MKYITALCLQCGFIFCLAPSFDEHASFFMSIYILPILKAAIWQDMKIVRSYPSFLVSSNIFPASSKENSSSVSLHFPFSLVVVAKRMVRSVSIRKMIDPELCACRFFRHALILSHRNRSVGETIFWDGLHTLRTIYLSNPR